MLVYYPVLLTTDSNKKKKKKQFNSERYQSWSTWRNPFHPFNHELILCQAYNVMVAILGMCSTVVGVR